MANTELDFQFFCPKGEKMVPQNGEYVIDPQALIEGREIKLDCEFNGGPKNIADVDFGGGVKLKMGAFQRKDLLILTGKLNQEQNAVEGSLDCLHCGHHTTLIFPLNNSDQIDNKK